MKASSAIRLAFIGVFLGVIGYGLYQIWYINDQYDKEEQMREQMQIFKPAVKYKEEHASLPAEEEDNIVIVNQDIIDAQQLNSDIVGWLTVDGTRIDYSFVQAADNDYYMNKDINGNKASAGTIFMDFRCQPDFTDFITVLYGHNMKNGSMFSDLRRYGNAIFFEENQTGQIHLPYADYTLRIFAFLEIRHDDMFIYGLNEVDNISKQQFISYIDENAIFYRDIEPSVSDRYVMLSTCTSDRKEMRRVVIARLEN